MDFDLDLPACPEPDHDPMTRRVVRDGYGGKPPRRRQRYRCVDREDRLDFHRFTPAVARMERRHDNCRDCESALHEWQGPHVAHSYEYTAREVSSALVSLARGSTYQEAAKTARKTVQTFFTRSGHLAELPFQPKTVAHGQVAADWLGVYGEVVLDGLEEPEWPAVVLLDSTSFYRVKNKQRRTAFHVLAVYGYDLHEATADEDDDEDPFTAAPVGLPTVGGRLVYARAFRSENTASWRTLLSAKAGRPKFVVCDRGNAAAGVSATWAATPTEPAPELVFCVYHLAENVREHLLTDLIAAWTGPAATQADRKARNAALRTHHLYEGTSRAFDDVAGWDTYWKLVSLELGADVTDPANAGRFAVAKWYASSSQLVRQQVLNRPNLPQVRSIAPLERELSTLRSRLAKRVQAMRNEARTNLLLRVMCAGRRGQADEFDWTDKVLAHLEACGGVPERQRKLAEPAGLPGWF